MEIEDLILQMRKEEDKVILRELVKKLMNDDDFRDFLSFNYRIISSPIRIDDVDDVDEGKILLSNNIALEKRRRVSVDEWNRMLRKLHEMDSKGKVVTKSQLERKMNQVLKD